jgi:S1-C subfamily serine protease
MNTESSFASLSNQLADVIEGAAASVVQVQGRRRPASGVVYAEDVVLTMARNLGRGDSPRVRRADGQTFEAELAGWDPSTSLAVLRVKGLGAPAIAISKTAPRVGNLAVAVARSWSNALTASVGIVSVIGGPLQTGRGRAIDEVIRTTAPMHDGFSGGAFLDSSGALIGIATASAIRGLGVIIPAPIAWNTAGKVLEHGGLKRGYIGIAGQSVRLPEGQRAAPDREGALLVVGVTSGSPAASAGILVGDIIVALDGHSVESPEHLFDLLHGDRIGRSVPLRILRGGKTIDVTLVVGERPPQ